MIIVALDAPEEPPPPVEPPPIPHQEFGVGITLVGTDGTVWDLATGPVYALADTTAFGAPDVDLWFREVASLDGGQYKGQKTPMREVELPLQVRPASASDWLNADRLLWKGLDPKREVYLYVTSPDADSYRYLRMRYRDGGNVSWEIDPNIYGESVYPDLTFMSPDPYWKGPQVRVPFEVSNDDAFFPGPPWDINPGNAVGSARVTNPGDVGAPWIAEIEGPFTEATVGVGLSVVTISANVLGSETRIIDTKKRTIVDQDGNDTYLEATDVKFTDIPPGEEVDLNLELVSPGVGSQITISFDPRYRRAW